MRMVSIMHILLLPDVTYEHGVFKAKRTLSIAQPEYNFYETIYLLLPISLSINMARMKSYIILFITTAVR